jgi:DMSO/TMAO reductase YedYZ molybdopterin-dependent catalytic subunit
VPTTPFTLADLQALPRQEVTAKSKDQGSSAYQGVPVGVLLGRATGSDKDRLKHGNILQYLVAEAADGYRAVLAMPEADTSSQRSAIMVAYRMNGAPLDSASGPLQLVAPLDLEHGRWVRLLECIRVAHDPGA